MYLRVVKNTEYSRSYKKIQDVLGNLNGVLDEINKNFFINININVRSEINYNDSKGIMSNKNMENEETKIPGLDNEINEMRAKKLKTIFSLMRRILEMQKKNKVDLLMEESNLYFTRKGSIKDH